MNQCSLINKSRNSRSFLKTLNSMISLSMLLPLLSGKIMMSRRAFSANFSVDAAKNSPKVVVVVSEERLTSFFAETLQLPSHNSCSMFTKLLRGVSTLLARAPLQSVSQFISPRTQRLVKLSSKVVLLSFLTVVFAASMSLTKWMIALV